MPRDDARRARAHGFRRRNVFLLLERDDLAAHKARHRNPADERIGDDDGHHAGFQNHHQQDDDNQIRNAVDDFQQAHHDDIQRAAEVAGNAAVNAAQNQVNQRADHGDGQRHAAAHPDSGENVAAKRVRAEIMHMAFALRAALVADCAHRRVGVAVMLLAVIEFGNHRRENAHRRQHKDDHDADHRDLVFPQTAHGVLHEREARTLDRLALLRALADMGKAGFFNMFHAQPSSFTRGSMKP